MPSPLAKNELQLIAETKLADSLLLLEHGKASNAYYLAGYSIELALKVCIAGQMQAGVIPDKQLILDTFTHNYAKLVGVAGLKFELDERLKTNPAFAENWAITQHWDPEARYKVIDKSIAQYFLHAIADTKNGVFTWIKSYW